ncbi:MAG: hypothetical protein JXA82_15750 [Sedimentisphaerales bacterium]|nr:hypothetical protein [Sedimentisphaerales bacterium]
MAKRAITLGLLATFLTACGCNQTQREPANCGWTMRARAQAELQDTPEPDAEYYVEYERTFRVNELTYYRTEPEPGQPAGTVYAVQKNLESDQSERMQ